MRTGILSKRSPMNMENPKPDPNSSVIALKQQWRKRLRSIRAAIDPDRRKEASLTAFEFLLKKAQGAAHVLSFASFSTEIDLWTFNRTLSQERRLILPCLAGNELVLYSVEDMTHLKTHEWGVLEPNPSLCKPVDFSKIEIALIPGLGFDPTAKIRLGYGGGYYDHLLIRLKSAVTCGVGFQEQSVEELPHDVHDHPLQEILLF